MEAGLWGLVTAAPGNEFSGQIREDIGLRTQIRPGDGQSMQENPKHSDLMPTRGAAPAPTSCLASGTPSPACFSRVPGPRSSPAPHGSSFRLRPAHVAAGGPGDPLPCSPPGLGAQRPGAPKTCLASGGPSTPGAGACPRPQLQPEPSVEEGPTNSLAGASVGNCPLAWRSLGPLRWEPCIWARPLGRVPPFPPRHHSL